MTWARSLQSLGLVLVLLAFGGSLRSVKADEYRTWVDKTGKFKVEASLHSFADGKVTLHTKDGREVVVPVAALSEGDQKFVNKLDVNPFSGGTSLDPAPAMRPQPSSAASNAVSSPTKSGGLLAKGAAATELPVDGVDIFINIDQGLDKIAADPVPAPVKFRQMVVPLEKLDAYAKVSQPIVIDPEKPTFAVSTNRVGNAVSPDNFGRIYLASFGKSRPVTAMDLDDTLKLIDHHVGTDRSVAVIGVDGSTERGGDLILLSGLSTGSPKALARWHLPEWEKPGFKPKVEFGKMLDGERAAVQVNDTLYIWNLQTGKSLFVLDKIRAGGKLAMSGSGKYLAVPVSGGVRVVETETGELLGGVSIATTLTPEAHFSPDGKLLGLIAGSQYVVWDLTSGRELADGTVEGVPGKFFGWIDNDYMMTQLAGIIDPELGMTLWKYSVPSGTDTVTLSGGIAVLDSYGSQPTTLVTLPVPHDPVTKVKRKLTGNSSDLLLIQPGTEVALKIDAIPGVDQEMIKTGLSEAVERAGWVVNPDSPIVLVAKIGRGEPMELNFRMLGAGFRSPGETAKITPYTASLEVKHGPKVLWTRKSENMVPRLLHLKKDQSVQEAVSEYEKPDPKFFTYLRLPPKVLKPEVAQFVGRSRIKEGRWADSN